MFAKLLNFFYPPRCAACDSQLGIEATHRVCPACLARAERLPSPLCAICGGPLDSATSPDLRCSRCLASAPAFTRARAVARYLPAAEGQPGTLASVIRRHKYAFDQSLGRALAEYLGDTLALDAQDYDVIVPVPLHRRRLLERGFNQAALLAAEVARRLDRPLDVRSLRRVRATSAQTARDLEERRRNVRGAFAVPDPARIQAMRVLLVDDVMTTGATVEECARALLRAGAKSVDVFTLARAL
ncbi:MAG: double zinc ribbon domain-containing protein [Candidatus Binataceae bacterium]